MVTFVLLALAAFRVVTGPFLRIVAGNLAAAIAALVAARGWPALARTLLAYGLAARVPVAIVMLVAMSAHWGTHYELGPTLPPLGTLATWVWIGLLPQMFFWMGFTVVVGMLVGTLAVLIVPPKAS